MRGHRILFALVVGAGLAAGSADAQELHRIMPQAAGRPAPISATGPAGAHHGSLGGPVNKVNGIDGSFRRPKH
jgi:hypothetical protein